MSAQSTPTAHKIVIVGGGFGGVRAALRLAGQPDVAVTLISANPGFSYYPQLYHAATGGVRSEASIPLADLFAGQPVELVQDTITVLDAENQLVVGASGTNYHYDELILALGSVTNYFGIEGLKEFSYNIKSIEGAERFKRHLHDQLAKDSHPELHYVVVGGGPTGVELAAALGDYLEQIIKQHHINAPKYQIDLVEAAPRLLPHSPEGYAARVQRRLEQSGVHVMTGATVEAETPAELRLKGKSIATKTVIWTAGVSNNPFFRNNVDHFTLAKNGRVEVNEYLEAAPHIRVIGDGANTQYTGMAQTAIYDANYVAADILRQLRGGARSKYKPKAPVSVIPVGKRWAAVQWGRLELYGFIGWILRRLADLIAYSDIESWPKAVRVWLQDARREDDCAVCN